MKIYHTYRRNLNNLEGIRFREIDESEKNNYQYITIEIDEQVANISRDLLMKILHFENIRARRYFYPGCHHMEPYRSYYPNAGILLPITEQKTDRVLCLPTGSSINPATAEKICSIIIFAVENSAEIKLRLQSETDKIARDIR